MNLIAQIEQNGYEVLPSIVSELGIKNLLSEITNAQLPRSRAGIRHLMGHPAVSRIAESEGLLSIVRLVLGEDAIPFRATLFDKSPSSNWLVMWHQDTALPLSQRKEIDGWGPWSVKDGVTYAHAPARALEQILAVRIHLDDSTMKNGPFESCRELIRQGFLAMRRFTNFRKM